MTYKLCNDLASECGNDHWLTTGRPIGIQGSACVEADQYTCVPDLNNNSTLLVTDRWRYTH